MIIEFLKKPKNTGSIVSSSKYLVNEMVSHVNMADTIIELGSGSGVVTKKLSEISEIKRIYAYENNHHFHAKLNRLDKVICMLDIDTIRQSHQYEKVKTVISSIPFVNFSVENRKKALENISSVLETGGVMIQFTYLNKCPFGENLLKENNLKIVHTKKVWLNIPPATVFVYKKEENKENI